MIRRLVKKDIDNVMHIWLETNVKAHNFISEQYWKGNFDAVKEMLPQAEIYVYENDRNHEIQGFIGINEEYIEGIFVCSEVQSQGIGKQLLEYAKTAKKRLTLSVYQQNKRAVEFYKREDFRIRSAGIDENTGEAEYLMVWESV